MIDLSELDRRIIAVLQRDASLSAADLAEAVHSSAATVWRRVQRLEAAGVLGAAVRLVDPRAVGRGVDVFCQVRMASQDAQARAAFQAAMEAEPTILEVYAVTGEWDYLLHILVRDIADFEAVLMRRVLDHKAVSGTSTTFALRRVKHETAVPV